MRLNKLKIFQNLPYPLKSLIASAQGVKLNYWRKRDRSEFLKAIAEKDGWSPQQLDDWREQKLKEVLIHAAETVPYYRAYWQQRGASTEHIVDLNNWPILEKDAIRNSPELFISDKFNKKDLYNIHTSGTSGKPMSFWFDRESQSLWYAMYEHRIKNWNGVSEQDRWANIGGQLIVGIERTKPPFWVYNYAMKQLYLSSYHIRSANIKHYIDAIASHKVKFLLGYVSSIYNLANEGLAQNLVMPQLKLVITNAEPLLDHQREVISKAFNCKVIQTYSGCEYAFGGNEDLNGSMFLWPEAGILEVVDDNDNFVSKTVGGQFIATGFVNMAMPLIRYRVGDSGKFVAADDVKSDIKFEALSEITGRTDDLILTPEGNLVGRLDPVFKADLRIKEAQIIQTQADEIVIKIVPFAAFSDSDEDEIISRLRDRVGASMKIRTDKVSEIPRGANGKFKAVVSLLNKKSGRQPLNIQ